MELALIEWIDHHGNRGDEQWTAKEIEETLKEPYTFVTVGHVVCETDTYVTLALEYHDSSKGSRTFRGFICIVKSLILKRVRLLESPAS